MNGWPLAAFALLLLAGCTQSGTPAPQDDGLAVEDVQIDDVTLGAISGVVVDEAIRPLAGILVQMTDGSQNSTTGDGGQFVFKDLAPGTYFLQASGIGFASAQTSVEVSAGRVATSRIQLTAQFTAQPYHTIFQHRGFIQFSPAVAGPIINIIIDTGLGMANPLCSCTMNFDTTGQDVKTIVVEALWEDTLPAPQGASTLYLEVFPLELDDGTSDIQGGFLPSPILKHYPIELWGENETNTQWNVRLTGDGYSVQYNQQYDLYATVFVNQAAPEGWSLVKGDL